MRRARLPNRRSPYRDVLLDDGRAPVCGRGPAGKCPPISLSIDTLGQVAATLSVVAFAAAGALQLSALAFISSWILAFLGVALEVAVQYLVISGWASCWIAIAILIGVLTNTLSFAGCMDQQQNAGRNVNAGSGIEIN